MAAHPIPISIIQGDQDHIDPAAVSWRPVDATIHVIPEASHIPWIDNPAAFAVSLRLVALGPKA
jgi:pimeloyl-ACP methyl ester carboxylesterase